MIERVASGDGTVVIVGHDADELGAAVRAATERGERVGAFVVTDDHADTDAALAEMIAELSGPAGARPANT